MRTSLPQIESYQLVRSASYDSRSLFIAGTGLQRAGLTLLLPLVFELPEGGLTGKAHCKKLAVDQCILPFVLL